ncbi:MAG TPA: type II secretion system F family protein, partial [Candidatus Thermoplasmatota archaeon]|nr:type II secretion system F family protein [Candidatus Thermoplasmatota archaeon]
SAGGALGRTALVVLLGAALALAGMTTLRRAAALRRQGSTEYRAPLDPGMRFLHVAATVLYNVILLGLLLAGAARMGWAPDVVPAGLHQAAPGVAGVALLLLASAAAWRMQEEGGVRRTWYTRVNGGLLAVLTVPLLTVTGALAARGGLDAGPLHLGAGDLPLVAMAGFLLAGMQVFLAADLPTFLDLRSAISAKPPAGVKIPRNATPPYVYAILLGLGGAVILGFILDRIHIVDRIGSFRNDRALLILLLLPVGLALFFFVSAMQIWKESRRGLYQRRLPRQLVKDILVYSTSALLGIGFSSLLVLTMSGRLDHVGPFEAGRDLTKDLTVLTIISTVGPIGVYMHRRNRRVDAIEARLPDFLNDLAETRRAGLTLAAALQSVALSNYGPLSAEIRVMANQVAWGLPFTDALQQFADRVKTGLVRRSASLIISASRTGGSVAEVLKAAAKDAYELKGLEEDRRVSMMTYLIVIYVVFAVFMTVIAVLDTKFIPAVLEAGEAAAKEGKEVAGIQLGSPDLDREGLRFVYFNAAVVQAVGNGIIGGVLSEGRITAGFRHVAIMTLLAWVLFRFLIGGI